jgi:2-polyprenyl-3-methyl-5-hydroxy-6-metoxy-1,4-benzoquinol methylase
MSHRVCPWWLGYLLVNPLRKLFHNPELLLKPYVREGMTVLEVGSGMGFFTLPLARLSSVGIDDLQDKVDFALLFAVVHEVPEVRQFLLEIHRSLRKGGVLMVAEPSGHVTQEAFAATLATAQELGFQAAEAPRIRGSHSSLLVKN